MKKCLSLILAIIFLFTLVSCKAKVDKEQIYFCGKIIEVSETVLLVEVTDSGNSGISVGHQAAVSAALQSGEDVPQYAKGDYVTIIFDGQILETYPLSIPVVYSIEKIACQALAGDFVIFSSLFSYAL